LRARWILGWSLATVAWAAARAADADPGRLIDRGHYKQARTVLQKHIAVNSRDADALVLMARILLAYGDPKGAEGLLRQALALQPRNSAAHITLADAYSRRVDDAGVFEKMKLAGAIHAECNEALADDPGNIDAMEGLVRFYLGAPGIVGGSLTKARDMADRIMALDRVRGHFALAQIARNEKESDKLEGYYLDAVAADPGSYEALAAAGSFYLQDGSRNDGKASDYARKALAIDPGRSAAYVTLVQVYVSEERWSDLDALLLRAEKDMPDDFVPHYVAGRNLLLQGKDPVRAEACFRKYLTQTEPEGETPSLAGAHWRLGQALDRLGKKKDAVGEIETAVQMDPDLKDAKQDLKRLKR
jgi:tetratricopeptide (TPR) repeat protein